MHEFIRSRLSRQKLQELYLKAALSNFVGYVAGSLVMVLTTYHSVERRALKNLYGILPRHSVVVHLLPEWLEWVLSILLGYLVMELVRYVVNKHLLAIDGAARDKAHADSEGPATTRSHSP